MAGTRRLQIDIVGDAKGLSRAFGETDSKLGRLSRSIGGIAKSAALGFAGIAGAAIIAGPKILELGTELDTMAKKSETVFGSSLGDVERWADGVASSMGLTSDQAVGMAANLGDLLKPMGFTADEAATMSTEMLDLSGALSAWTGGTQSAAEVSEVLSKAMLGEREGLKSLGISISEADVQTRLLENGQSDLTGAALEQAKAIATQQLIMEKSADAQEAWSDGTMDGIKAQNEAKASIEEVKEGLVKALFPALQAVVPYVATVAQWIGDHMPAAMETAQAFIEERLVPAFEEHLLPVIEAVVGWVRDNWPQISEVIGNVAEAVSEIITGAIDMWTAVWEQFGDDILGFVEAVWPHVQQIIAGAFEVLTGIYKAFAAFFRGDWSALWEAVQQIVSGAWELIKGTVGAAIDALAFLIGAGWGLIKTITGDAAQAVVDAIAAIPGLIIGMGSSFFNAAMSIGVALLNGLKNALSSAVGFAGDVAAGVLAAVKSVINSAVIGPINSALEFSIPMPLGLPDININPPDIPYLAAGGVVTRPTLAVVGEAGPEAVIPLSRAGRRLAGIDGGEPIVIELHVDGRRMATAVADASQRVGGLPFKVRGA